MGLGFCTAYCIEWWNVQAEPAAHSGQVPAIDRDFKIAWWVGIVGFALGALWLDRCVRAARAREPAACEDNQSIVLPPAVRWIAIVWTASVAGAGAWLFAGYPVMLPLFMGHGGDATPVRLGNVVGTLYVTICVLAAVLAGCWVFLLTHSPLWDPMMRECARAEGKL